MPLESSDRDAALLLDMLTAARAARSFVAGRSIADYLNDLLLRSAVERQIEIVGEAARGVSDSFKTAHPQIAWRPIVAQRHRLAHEYGAVNDELIWTVATVHLAVLIEQLESIVPPTTR